MARNTNKKKAGINKQLWESSNNAQRIKWQITSQKGHDFYLCEQLTKKEKDDLEESGMPTFDVNRVTPIIEIMKYFITANNPKWQAVAAEGSDTDVAHMFSSITEYSWYLSNGKSVYSQVVTDSLTKGIGYFMVDIDPDLDMGKGEVLFKRIDPYDVYPDPMSRDSLFRDAGYIIIKKNIPKQQLINLFPDYANKIKKVSNNGELTQYSQSDRDDSLSIQPDDVTSSYNADTAERDQLISYFEVYRKKKYPYYSVYLQVPSSNEEKAMAQQEVEASVSEYKKEIEVQTKERLKQIDIAFQNGEIIEERAELEKEKTVQNAQQKVSNFEQHKISEVQEKLTKIEHQILPEKAYKILVEDENLSQTIQSATRFNKTMIDVSVSIGDDVLLFEYVLRSEEYPIVPIPYMYTGTPYPMSAVVPMIGKQQEINKAHQIMLHNANLASNLRWLYEEGSVPEDEWEKYSSAPGALLKYRQGFQPPTPILPAPINNAFYTVTQEGKQDAEYISGIPSSMMGFVQNQPDTYRGMLANDEFGTRRLKAWMGSIVEPALEHLGNVYKDRSQQHYSADKIFRIIQPEAGKTNLEEKEVRINIPIYNDYGEVIGRWNDYETARFDIRMVAGTTMPINRWALLEEYFKWFQAGLIDDIAMLGESDIRNKESIIERKSLYSQLQQQINALTDSVKSKDGTIETLERQLVQSGIRHQVDLGEKEITKDVLTTEAQQKTLRNAMKNEFEMAKRELRNRTKNEVNKK